MGIRYYRLFDLLNRKGMKKSDLRKVISSATVAKLSKGEYISGEAIEKICIFLSCQPGDIMEVVEIEDELNNNSRIITERYDVIENISRVDRYFEVAPSGMSIAEADALGVTERQHIDSEYE